jgi:hypothetical protein
VSHPSEEKIVSACLVWIRRNWGWTESLVLFGLVLRAIHYGRNPSMWHDEAALVLNVLDKNFLELLGPLEFAEAAPPLFLWLERAVFLLMGDGTYALRLPSFLASCAALLLIPWLARQILRPGAAPWATLLFACSDHLLWHASEAKPYSFDVLAATMLACLFCLGRRRPLELHLILQAALAPVVIFLSFPGCFLYGGLLVAFLPAVWQSKRISGWLAYALLTCIVFVAFALLAMGPVRAQRHELMDQCWLDAFPPWDRPWTVPGWLVMSTLDMIRFCCEPAGNALAGVLVVGGVCFWRNRQRAVLALLVLPIGLALLASCVRAYPYAGARVMVYASPAVILLLAEGVRPTLAWFRARFRLGVVLLIVLLFAPLGQVVNRLGLQGGRSDCASAAQYVLAHREPAETVTSAAWEARYYFRHLGADYRTMDDFRPEELNRFWLVAISADASERRQAAEEYTLGNWQVVNQREYARTTVYLLERASRNVGARSSATNR